MNKILRKATATKANSIMCRKIYACAVVLAQRQPQLSLNLKHTTHYTILKNFYLPQCHLWTVNFITLRPAKRKPLDILQ